MRHWLKTVDTTIGRLRSVKMRDIHVLGTPRCLLYAAVFLLISHTEWGLAQTDTSPANTRMFNFPRQHLSLSLQQLASQSNLQFIYQSSFVYGHIAEPLHGHYSVKEALHQLLRNVDLTFIFRDERTVTLVKRPQGQSKLPIRKEDRYIEEIVVSARKRNENLQKVPLAVSVFSETELELRGASTTSDVALFTPNLIYEPPGGTSSTMSGANVFIRGIGQLDGDITFDPGVGIYLDGVYIPRILGNVLSVAGIDRIEVLKGPQGTLFGKNTTGGALNIISAKPSGETWGKLSVAIGDDNHLRINGFTESTITDHSLAGMFAFSYQKQDGYISLPLINKELGNENNSSIRSNLLWSPSRHIDINWSFDYNYRNESSAAQSLFDVNEDATVLTLWNDLVAPQFGVRYDRSWLTDSPFESLGTASEKHSVNIWGSSLTATYNRGETELKSITSLRSSDIPFGYDGDHSPLPIFDVGGYQRHKLVSQELHYSHFNHGGKLHWLAGLYALIENSKSVTDSTFLSGLFDALEQLDPGNPDNTGFDLDIFTDSRQRTESYAAFGHTSLALTNALSVSIGLRITYEHKRYRTTQLRTNADVFAVSPTSAKDNWSSFSPRLGLDYSLGSRGMLYVSVADGFKSGGFDADTLGSGLVTTYDPEFVRTYELGFKGQWFERRLLVNSAVFYTDYTDIQLTNSGTTTSGNIVTLVENAGKANIKGFELELTAIAPLDIEFNAGIGYTRARYTELNPNASISRDSNFAKTPRWTVNIGLQRSLSWDGYGLVTLRGDYLYRSDYFSDVQNTAAGEQRGFSLVNARIELTGKSSRWKLALSGSNLTNTRYLTHGVSALDTVGFAFSNYGRPRGWSVSATYFF